MFESIESVLIEYGYEGLFIASFMASTILPFGSEGILILLVQRNFDIISIVLVASTGNFLGACTSYYIGLKGRKPMARYLRLKERQADPAEKIFSRYGSLALLFTWLPVIGDAITVAGGLLRLDFRIFSVFVFSGKFLRYIAVAFASNALL